MRDIFYSTGYIDEMCPPTGVRVMLLSEHGGPSLARGEHPDGSWTTAWEQLLAEVAKNLPGLDADFVKKLHRKDAWF
jgi:hypothetical protein